MSDNQHYYPWRWILGRLLPGLSTERPCSVNEFPGCWILGQLDSWNRALRPTRLVLTEFEPGRLCLRSYDDRDDYGEGYGGCGNVNDGAFLLAWLPRQHRCILEVRVNDRAHIDRLSFMSSVVIGPAPSLERIVLHPRRELLPSSGYLQAFGPPQCLRSLDLVNIHVSDALASNVAEVLRGSASTLNSVKFVGNNLSRDSAGILLLALFSCERLKDLTLEDTTTSSACDLMAEYFSSSKMLQKLSLVGLCEAGMRCRHFNFASGGRVCLDCLKDLFAALRGILSLHHLALEEMSIGGATAKALAEFLTGHHALQTLSLLNCSFDITGATSIAETLSVNGTLEHLNLHNCSLQAEIISKLCSALPVNTTLKSLVLPEISSRSLVIQQGNPTLELLRLESPGRVHCCLFVDRPSLVSQALEQALKCVEAVKIRHGMSARNDLCSVYSSLALNHSLRSLHIDYSSGSGTDQDSTPEALIVALCTALKACECLQTFHLDVRSAYHANEETAPLFMVVFHALALNRRLRKLSVVTPRLTFKTAVALSALVSQCKRSLVELHILSIENMPITALDVLHNMVTTNVFLSTISVRCSDWRDVMQANAAVDEAKERNRVLLNRAAQFVTSIDGEPAWSAQQHCAAAFDDLCATASLREHLASLSGKSALQVSLDVKKARRYLQDNYMVFARVVRAAVVCEGDGSTQLDDLNVECWRAIAQYLKLSDVVR
ncbi:hypothetical protein V5799_027280 [Amblyomma americanum]|uniref:Ran gtpase-activating protein n=1 Tax=Amblyomma americanum TaxID=6943 RepID=A0AAQ4DG63_AMBAM